MSLSLQDLLAVTGFKIQALLCIIILCLIIWILYLSRENKNKNSITTDINNATCKTSDEMEEKLYKDYVNKLEHERSLKALEEKINNRTDEKFVTREAFDAVKNDIREIKLDGKETNRRISEINLTIEKLQMSFMTDIKNLLLSMNKYRD